MIWKKLFSATLILLLIPGAFALYPDGSIKTTISQNIMEGPVNLPPNSVMCGTNITLDEIKDQTLFDYLTAEYTFNFTGSKLDEGMGYIYACTYEDLERACQLENTHYTLVHNSSRIKLLFQHVMFVTDDCDEHDYNYYRCEDGSVNQFKEESIQIPLNFFSSDYGLYWDPGHDIPPLPTYFDINNNQIFDKCEDEISYDVPHTFGSPLCARCDFEIFDSFNAIGEDRPNQPPGLERGGHEYRGQCIKDYYEKTHDNFGVYCETRTEKWYTRFYSKPRDTWIDGCETCEETEEETVEETEEETVEETESEVNEELTTEKERRQTLIDIIISYLSKIFNIF
jgi:hypothetical protein